MSAVLHTIYDPLCGWCYAAEPLLEAAAEASLPIEMHAGGLFSATYLPEAMREHIRHADARIGALSGQPFGVQGFPGFVLQQGERWQTLRHERHYGQPEAFAAALSALRG
ncbi:MAG: hypothetical protein ACREX0_01940 [Noviherbaspirillum sp.]